MTALFFKTASIFLISAAGFILRRRGDIDTRFNRQLSLLQINVVYPALILSSLTRNFTWSSLLTNWTLPGGSALIMLVGWLVGFLLLPLLHRQAAPTRAMFHFQCAINNYSFLPIMLALLLLGEQGVADIIYSAIGAEIVVWTLGIQALTAGTAATAPPAQPLVDVIGQRLRNLASMPLLAMALGAGWLLLGHITKGASVALFQQSVGLHVGEMVTTALKMTGDATIPIAALIVGARIGEMQVGQIFSRLIVGTTLLRLVVIPALATLLLLWLPFPAAVRPPLLIVAAQPAAMASVMFGEVYQCDARFAAATVLTTHLLCLLTIPLWLSAPWW